jgi:two-component system cell cycle sensor histidine kinase/response regulator CckA
MEKSDLPSPEDWDRFGKSVSRIAHDFNNVLTVINGYSTLLADRLDLSEDVRGDLLSIARAGARAAALTTELSDIGRKMRTSLGPGQRAENEPT